MLKEINSKNLPIEVMEADVALVDFYATWCGPCKMIAPILHEIAEENDDVLVAKVNVDENSELASQFNIISIPTLIVLRKGVPVSTKVGYMPKTEILKMLNI